MFRHRHKPGYLSILHLEHIRKCSIALFKVVLILLKYVKRSLYSYSFPMYDFQTQNFVPEDESCIFTSHKLVKRFEIAKLKAADDRKLPQFWNLI